MLYRSTRGSCRSVSAAEAIKRGIAADGGLFVPEKTVQFNLEQIALMSEMSYQERAVKILEGYLDDYTFEELSECVNKAYTAEKFESNDIAPLHKLYDSVNILELWHGPTSAFKDMALQILPHFLVKALKKTGEKEEIVILVATSGDTGKAALEGFKDVKGTKIIVFFPSEGVSQVQKMQMVTQEGGNVHAIAVNGNFDDAQNGVKRIFGDEDVSVLMEENGYKFSSANSINWGRLAPQIVYYFSAYADMIKKGEIKAGEKINFVVPTGNFGNILAAYYAMQMGLPVNKLICASNDNNVLTDFINTGEYNKNRDFKKTLSPSMDILISSNLERLLYLITGDNAEKVCEWMNKLKNEGSYTVDQDTKKKIQNIFWAGYSNDSDTLKTIESVYQETGYVVDTHTAVAVDVYDKYVISTSDVTKAVIVSTASPFKFNESVVKAIAGEETIKGKTEFELLSVLSEKSGLRIPAPLKELDKKPVLHKGFCEPINMIDKVKDALNIQENIKTEK
ncbi:threonine synthase [Clostridium sp. BNL1100]|uniref:threonine synthase n=1 Tax=Clostridium sp. BNL1100 TaxID=755731 RepID=UPI00024A7251|nr:threonine synthase [Clostridium sp. BNL1100]AEY65473.1 threonine synthase [Clostridium sp. BNL1100]